MRRSNRARNDPEGRKMAAFREETARKKSGGSERAYLRGARPAVSFAREINNARSITREHREIPRSSPAQSVKYESSITVIRCPSTGGTISKSRDNDIAIIGGFLDTIGFHGNRRRDRHARKSIENRKIFGRNDHVSRIPFFAVPFSIVSRETSLRTG